MWSDSSDAPSYVHDPVAARLEFEVRKVVLVVPSFAISNCIRNLELGQGALKALPGLSGAPEALPDIP